MEKISDVFRKTKIWEHFKSKVKEETKNKLTVEQLVDDSIDILNTINETFPTYTLHNGQHQLNILNLYAKLLGKRLSKLTGLETAILILSAFYHDIGMAYTKEERKNFEQDELFQQFLIAKPAARLKSGDELADWYFRWAHAKRVKVYLNKIPNKIVWDEDNFRKELAEVCLSHNEPTKYIRDSKVISVNCKNEADLKFCAILLRLADILDFDDTRSPESLYKHLGLDKPKNKAEKISQREYLKHFASKGFKFQDWDKKHPYKIYYEATPGHPAVENEINEFLDVIENEIQYCRIALNSCSERWRDFVLPSHIDRQQIRSQGYTSGAFKFSLDQNQILQLLMGESLYDNPYVFIRELVQNAIDTSRHRVKHEKNVIKNDNHTQKHIEFTDWIDKDGYRWIRIDDYGMGMTLDQIKKYFLKVGNSFYNSDDFRLSKIDYSTEDENFTPISRFGIGILSCFMVSDEIEVSTKSVYCNNQIDFPIRLSLRGLQNYYFLFTEDDIPKKAMPNENDDEELYRNETGTSIAIRLKHNFNRDELKIMNELEKLLYSSDVLIKYNSSFFGSEKIGNLPNKILNHKLSDEETKRIMDYLNDPDIVEMNPEIHRVPIMLSNLEISNADGMLYVILFKTNIKYNTSIDSNTVISKSKKLSKNLTFEYRNRDGYLSTKFLLTFKKNINDKNSRDLTPDC